MAHEEQELAYYYEVGKKVVLQTPNHFLMLTLMLSTEQLPISSELVQDS